MAKKCKRGEYEMPNGECYSDRRIMKALTAEVSGNPGGYSCHPESGPLKPGIRVVGKGRNLYADRHGYGRCVHLKDIEPPQRMRILERIIKDRILTSYRGGQVGGNRPYPEIKLSSRKGDIVEFRRNRRRAKIMRAHLSPDGEELFDVKDRISGKVTKNVKPGQLWFF